MNTDSGDNRTWKEKDGVKYGSWHLEGKGD